MAINSEEEKTLDFKVIKNPLNKVIEFFIEKWGQRPFSPKAGTVLNFMILMEKSI